MSRAPWHALLAPLPADARVQRKPVVPSELRGSPTSAAIAGWEQLTVLLSAGEAGLRHVLVTLDETGRAISAGDLALFEAHVTDASGAALIDHVQESIGGRFEPDGRFLGTRWRTTGRYPPETEEPPLDSVPSAPSEAEAEALRALVADVLARAPARAADDPD
jgi:hypothetical protein